jgi:hypothetical protein
MPYSPSFAMHTALIRFQSYVDDLTYVSFLMSRAATAIPWWLDLLTECGNSAMTHYLHALVGDGSLEAEKYVRSIDICTQGSSALCRARVRK